MLAAQAERDERDREREHGALRAADDAVELDTTGLAVDEVVDRVVALARERGLAVMAPRPAADRGRRLSRTSASRRWSTGWSAGARRSSTARPG